MSENILCDSCKECGKETLMSYRNYLTTSYYSSAFQSTNVAVFHYECHVCSELTGLDKPLRSENE